jgi:hypothetical protein
MERSVSPNFFVFCGLLENISNADNFEKCPVWLADSMRGTPPGQKDGLHAAIIGRYKVYRAFDTCGKKGGRGRQD